jgi:hypothetical protein
VNPWPSNDEGPKSAAYAVYSEKVELQHVVQSLNQAGFRNKDICLLLAPAHPLAGLARDRMLLSPEGDHAASSQLINWLLGFGGVMIPRTGSFFRSRSFLQALMVEPQGSPCQRNEAALSNLGFRESDAHRFAGLISDTGGFIYVSCSQVAQSQCAREILRNTGAEEARCLQESPQVRETLQ